MDFSADPTFCIDILNYSPFLLPIAHHNPQPSRACAGAETSSTRARFEACARRTRPPPQAAGQAHHHLPPAHPGRPGGGRPRSAACSPRVARTGPAAVAAAGQPVAKPCDAQERGNTGAWRLVSQFLVVRRALHAVGSRMRCWGAAFAVSERCNYFEVPDYRECVVHSLVYGVDLYKIAQVTASVVSVQSCHLEFQNCQCSARFAY